jgi:hypothetical protein
MNEMDLLTRFRAEVPLGVSPHAEELFQAGMGDHATERPVAPAPRHLLARIGLPWRFAIAAGLAAGLVAGLLIAVQPSRPPRLTAVQPSSPAPTLTAKLLADRAAAAALTGPTVPGGQWVYQRTVTYQASPPAGMPARLTQGSWQTAEGSLSYNPGVWGYGADHSLYSKLGSLPPNPIALDRYLAKLSYPNANATQTNNDVAAFSTIEQLLSTAILPPSVNAELYRALGDIPTVQVKSHITDVDGRAGIAFLLPETSQSANLEIILDASDYSYLAQAAWEPSNGSPNSAIPFTETAVLTTTLVSGPGSVQADSAPPSPAELTVEQAAMALLNNQKAGLGVPDPSQWIYRELGADGGTRDVWARADDTEQASYVNGTLVTCARSTSCAGGTTWLVSAGPAFDVVDPSMRGPWLPYNPQPLLDKLNTYRTGCLDTAGYCNAVGVIANLLNGYADVGISSLTWYFSLADVPGVTVQNITDAAGRADVEFSFPYTSGVTGILFNARTYQFAGYVRSGAQTLLLQQASVARPGVLP